MTRETFERLARLRVLSALSVAMGRERKYLTQVAGGRIAWSDDLGREVDRALAERFGVRVEGAEQDE